MGAPNGLGAAFMPPWIRDRLTAVSDAVFPSKPHVGHDTAYARGGREIDRIRADIAFLMAMLDDAWVRPPHLAIPASALAAFWFLCVLAFGWASSFNYGDD